LRYQIVHKTSYVYANPVSVSHHILRLSPRAFARQRPLDYQLLIEPKPALIASWEDYFGNSTASVTVQEPHHRFTLIARSVVEVSAPQTPKSESSQPWESIRDLCRGSAYSPAGDAAEFAFSSSLVPRRPEFAEYAGDSFPAGRPILSGALDLMDRIHSDFKFDTKATTVTTPVEQVFRQRRGVCQDFAHLQIACLRSLGLPARYVSGYLETLPPPGKPRLVGADSSHAWLQVWCHDLGWIDLDPTNNLVPADRHITVAWARDYDDISPVRGVLTGGGRHHLEVAVDVTPLLSEPD
jgi:transglutaminase-like putative cysteine protease